MARNDEVLKSFLVSLGFQIDENSYKRFADGMVRSDSAVAAVGKTVAAVAVAAEAMVQVFSNQMEKLYYVSQRTKASVKNIQALEFGYEQIGLSAEAARGSLEGMAAAMRLNPAMRGLLDSLVGHKTEGQDPTKSMLELVKALGKMPHYVGAGFAAMFGMDETTFLMLVQKAPELEAAMARRNKLLEESGVDAKDAAEAGKEYKNTLRDIWEHVEILNSKIAVEMLLPTFRAMAVSIKSSLDDFSKWKFADTSLSKGLVELSGELDKVESKFGVASKAAEAFKFIVWAIPEGLANIANFVVKNATLGAAMLAGDQKTVEKMLKEITPGSKFTATPEGGSRMSSGKIGGPPTAVSSELASMPLGMRHHNPGNLMPGGHIATYANDREGLDAMAGLLLKYAARGQDTISKIIGGVGPGTAYSATDQASYIATLSKKLGVGANEQMNLKDPKVLAGLMSAMVSVEQGNKGYAPISMGEFTGAAQGKLGTTIHQTNTITVNAPNANPTVLAQEFGREMGRVNGDLTRNAKGAAN